MIMQNFTVFINVTPKTITPNERIKKRKLYIKKKQTSGNKLNG
jgi:hypothetical protein